VLCFTFGRNQNGQLNRERRRTAWYCSVRLAETLRSLGWWLWGGTHSVCERCRDLLAGGVRCYMQLQLPMAAVLEMDRNCTLLAAVGVQHKQCACRNQDLVTATPFQAVLVKATQKSPCTQDITQLGNACTQEPGPHVAASTPDHLISERCSWRLERCSIKTTIRMHLLALVRTAEFHRS
jgi:hypothetical protein